MYDVHYVRTMPDVCRGNRSGESIQSGHRKHESEGRLRRFCFKYLQMDRFNHQVELTKGVLQEECSTMLSDFLKNCGKKRKLSLLRFYTHP